MTREECIQKIKDLDIDNNCSADEFIYDDLREIVIEYNPNLDYFFKDYYKEEYVYQCIWDNSRYLEEVADQLSGIDQYTGMYYLGECGWETANLYQLQDDILKKLKSEENELSNNDVWTEEDDDFLTEGVNND